MTMKLTNLLLGIAIMVAAVICLCIDKETDDPDNNEKYEEVYTPWIKAMEKNTLHVTRLLELTDMKYAEEERSPGLYENTATLVNRMMAMYNEVYTPEEAWAWTLAMDKCLEVYNRHTGRQQARDETTIALMEEFLDPLCSGGQYDMNYASYVYATISHYRAVMEYRRAAERYYREGQELLRGMYYREYCCWHRLMSAQYDLMCGYTYAMAAYSSLPMELNTTQGSWYDARREELENEFYQSIYDGKKIEKTGKVSQMQFAGLLEKFRNYEKDAGYKANRQWWESVRGADENNAVPETPVDKGKITATLCQYEKALQEWRSVRTDMEDYLPKQERKAFRTTTENTHARLFKDLAQLRNMN